MGEKVEKKMYRLSLKRYSIILFFQLLFLVFDLGANSFSFLAKDKNSVIFLYLAQNGLLILSLATLMYSLYSTYIYQVSLLVSRKQSFVPSIRIILKFLGWNHGLALQKI